MSCRIRVPGLWWIILLAGLIFTHGASDSIYTALAQDNEPAQGIHIEYVDRDADQSHAWLKIMTVSDTPLPETWAVVRDISRWGGFVGLIYRVKCIEHNGPVSRYIFFIDLPWPLTDTQSTLRVETQEDRHVLDYQVEEGLMMRSYGKVSVGARGRGTWVLFENYGEPENRFPDWMVEIGVHLVLPSVLDDFHGEIEQRMREGQPRQ